MDWYQLGVITYEMLSGHALFEYKEKKELYSKI